MYMCVSPILAKAWALETTLPKLSLQLLGGVLGLRSLWRGPRAGPRPRPVRVAVMPPAQAYAALSPLPSPVLRPGLHRAVWGDQQPGIPTAIPQTLQLHLQHPPGGGVQCQPGLRGVLRCGDAPRDPVPLRLPQGLVPRPPPHPDPCRSWGDRGSPSFRFRRTRRNSVHSVGRRCPAGLKPKATP